MIDISVELDYLIKHGYEPSNALRFIMEGKSKEIIISEEDETKKDEE